MVWVSYNLFKRRTKERKNARKTQGKPRSLVPLVPVVGKKDIKRQMEQRERAERKFFSCNIKITRSISTKSPLFFSLSLFFLTSFFTFLLLFLLFSTSFLPSASSLPFLSFLTLRYRWTHPIFRTWLLMFHPPFRMEPCRDLQCQTNRLPLTQISHNSSSFTTTWTLPMRHPRTNHSSRRICRKTRSSSNTCNRCSSNKCNNRCNSKCNSRCSNTSNSSN